MLGLVTLTYTDGTKSIFYILAMGTSPVGRGVYAILTKGTEPADSLLVGVSKPLRGYKKIKKKGLSWRIVA